MFAIYKFFIVNRISTTSKRSPPSLMGAINVVLPPVNSTGQLTSIGGMTVVGSIMLNTSCGW